MVLRFFKLIDIIVWKDEFFKILQNRVTSFDVFFCVALNPEKLQSCCILATKSKSFPDKEACI